MNGCVRARMGRLVLAGWLGLVAAQPGAAGEPSAAAEPEGYRREAYRAPVPSTLEGAVVLDTAGLILVLAREPAVLVDVMPAARRPAGRGADRPWLPPRRSHLPGSVWLANVGLGDLPPSTAAWFARRLDELTGGEKARPLVFYCERECWMSWNAAKRARHELGYTRVYWYPDGIQGWEEAGLPLVPATPEQEPEE